MSKILLRRGSAAQWTAANSILDSGEIGYESDTGKAKIGDGSTLWTALPYVLLADINAALALKVNESIVGQPSGLATLDAGGKIPTGQLPAIAITDTYVVASASAMLALAAQVGDVAIRTDLNKSFILQAEPASTVGNWKELLTPTDLVQSVDGRTGTVTLSDLYAAKLHASTHGSGGADAITIAQSQVAGLDTDLSAKAPLASPTFTGVVSADAGAASAPALTFTGDSNTGLWSPAADTVAFSTGGVERLRINSAGRVGIGTSSPNGPIHTYSTANGDQIILDSAGSGATANMNIDIRRMVDASSGDRLGAIRFYGSVTGTSYQAARIQADVDGTPGASDMPGRLTFSTTADGASSPTERMRIDSAGNVGIGTSSPAWKLHVTTTGSQSGILQEHLSNSELPLVRLYRTRASGAAVQNGDYIGGIDYATYVGGSSFPVPARILGAMDGTVSSTAAPSRLEVYTTPAGSLTPTERMRIDNAGRVSIATGTPQSNARLTALGAASTADAAIAINQASATGAGSGSLVFAQDGTEQARIYPVGGGNLVFATGGTYAERMRIDSSGNVGIGTSSPGAKLNVYDATSSAVRIEGDSGVVQIIRRAVTSASGPQLYWDKARGTIASSTVVSSGDVVGQLLFRGHDGTDFRTAAAINAVVDTTPGANDMPGRLEFYTTADGSATPTERMRIDNAGLITGSGTSLGAWTAWTPALTASTTNPTLGTGSATEGAYCRIGKIVHYWLNITFGSSGTNAGSGYYFVSLPITARSLPWLLPMGSALLLDSSAGKRVLGAAIFDSTTRVAIQYQTDSTGTDVVYATAPWTWAASDHIHIQGTYEAA